jgi:phospholipid/cholesterol/gamma-HCH transport system substrate-binding protein
LPLPTPWSTSLTWLRTSPSSTVGSGKEGVGRDLVGAIRSIKDTADTGKEALVQSKKVLAKVEEALTGLQQTIDASKKLPIVRGYVEDPVKLLVRADAERNRKVLAETDLFEAGRAELTAGGRARLDEVGRWMNRLKHPGSDVVIAAYADPGKALPAAKEVTRQQAEAVANYLKDKHRVESMGTFSRSRKVTPLGMGAQPAPQPEAGLPPARVEMLVFVPQR